MKSREVDYVMKYKSRHEVCQNMKSFTENIVKFNQCYDIGNSVVSILFFLFMHHIKYLLCKYYIIRQQSYWTHKLKLSKHAKSYQK